MGLAKETQWKGSTRAFEPSIRSLPPFFLSIWLGLPNKPRQLISAPRLFALALLPPLHSLGRAPWGAMLHRQMGSHATVAEACPIGRALGPMPISCRDTSHTGHFHQVASSTHQQLWPRALSEVRLHDEPAVSFACDFSFDVITPYLPSVVQGAINRWRDESMLPGCDSQKASDVARTQFDRAVGADAIRLGKITIANPEAPLVGADESYALNVSSGLLSIAAPSPWGVLHALTSLGQLLNTTSHPATILPIAVTDAPTYKHRGLMLDPARNFLPIGLLQKVIRGLSLLKLNVLHLDLINAPSFPFVAPSHPEFAQHGAYPGMNYTAAELHALVGYGARPSP